MRESRSIIKLTAVNASPQRTDSNLMKAAPHIVLVHGLARSKYDMFLMAPRLRELLPGSTIHAFDYRTRRLTIAEAAAELREFVDGITTTEPVSFVGHSLGGVVTRALDVSGGCKAPMHRLVTLGTPHYGATIARVLSRYSVPRRIFGPVLSELGHLNLREEPRQLEIACVIGGTNHWIGFIPIFGENNDGVVLAREAHLKTCVAHKQVPIYHTFFPYSRRAAKLAATFLSSGTFE